MIVKLKNNVGFAKTAVLGFSWTTLFFGCLVPLVRGDLRWFFVMAIVFSTITPILVLFPTGLTFILYLYVMVLFAEHYNTNYIKELMERGFFPADEESKEILKKAKIFEE